MSSTPVFDLQSYLSSLLGSQSYLQTQQNTLKSEVTTLSSQPQTQLYASHYDSDTGQPIYSQIPSDAANKISADNQQIPILQTQLDQLKTQISAAQSQVNLQNSTPRTISSASSPDINFGNISSTISKLPPLILLGGVGLLILLIK